MVDNVIIVAFQIIFCAEIHANDIFLFFKNHFWYQHIKMIQNIQTILNFNKKKLNFLEMLFAPRSQTVYEFKITWSDVLVTTCGPVHFRKPTSFCIILVMLYGIRYSYKFFLKKTNYIYKFFYIYFYNFKKFKFKIFLYTYM